MQRTRDLIISKIRSAILMLMENMPQGFEILTTFRSIASVAFYKAPGVYVFGLFPSDYPNAR